MKNISIAAFGLIVFGPLLVRASQPDPLPEPPPGFGKGAELVAYAKVVDSHSSVRAGSKQTFVAKNQGWAAIKIEILKIKKGSVIKNVVWIDDVQVASAWPKSKRDFPENSYFYFALNRSSELSKWCETEVFELAGMSPDTIVRVAD